MEKPILNPKYKILYTSPARYFFLYGGRGSAKSFHISDFLLKLTYEAGHKILFTRYTMKSAEKSVFPEFLDKIWRYECMSDFHVRGDEIVNIRTQSKIIFSGIKTSEGLQTAKLKSIPDLTTWILDEAEEMPDIDTFNTIDESIRKPEIQNRVIFVLNPSYITHWIYAAFFDGLPHEYSGRIGVEGIEREYIYSNYLENSQNLSKSFLAKAEKTKGEDLLSYNNRYLGHWAEQNPDALWHRKDIIYHPAPELRRIVIGVDPATTSNVKSDETGIVVVGLGVDKKAYILEDLTDKYSPEKWAQAVVTAYHKWNADLVRPEVNQGGDMVKTLIHQIDRTVNVKGVQAIKSKKSRAEPVQGLYSSGLVFHVKPFPKLEAEMLTYTGLHNEKSPNSLDAMVHAMAELMLKPAHAKLNLSHIRNPM